MYQEAFKIAPVFVAVLVRVAGMMVSAPLLGNRRIPRRVRTLMALVLAFGLFSSLKTSVVFPETGWGTAIALGGEMLFGVAMGMILNFTFMAVQWAGELAGQQMGLNLGEVFNPEFGAQTSVVGDMYFTLSLIVFIALRGHHSMIRGVHESLSSVPLLSLTINRSLLDMMIGLLDASTSLAVQVAAPMLVTMLVVDLAMGFIGKTIPGLNVMTAGVNLRAVVGMLVLIAGMILTSDVMSHAVTDSMNEARLAWMSVASG